MLLLKLALLASVAAAAPPAQVDPFGCHKKTDCKSCVEKSVIVDCARATVTSTSCRRPSNLCLRRGYAVAPTSWSRTSQPTILSPLVDACRADPCYWCEIDNLCHDVGSVVSPCSPASADDKCISLSHESNCYNKDVSACPTTEATPVEEA